MTQRTTLNGFEYIFADADQSQLNILGAGGWAAVGLMANPVGAGNYVNRVLLKRPISHPAEPAPQQNPASILHFATEARRVVQWVRRDFGEVSEQLSGAVGYLDRIIKLAGGEP